MTHKARVSATLRAMLPSILTAIVLSLAGLLAVRRLVPAEILRETNDVAGNYLQTVGTIFAVLLAFVVFVVWQQFNDARTQVETEANELMDLIRAARGLPAAVRAPLLQQASAYVDLVLGREWDAMAKNDEAGLEEGARVLDRAWNLLVSYEPASECHKSLYDVALDRFNDLSDTRANRLTSARLRIPLALRLLLWAGAITVVGSMYLFAVERLAVHALMTGALAGAISHVMYVIHDLDECFDGDWQVPRAAFERVRRYLGEAVPGEPTGPGAARQDG
jgi:hypothetical protein